MQSGYSVPEVIAVLTVAGILAGIAAPRMARMHDTLAVDYAARQIASAHHRARTAAILSREVVMLTIDADSMVIRSKKNAALLWRDAGPTADGVSFSAPFRLVRYSPIGLAIGVSNTTYAVTRGDARRSVIVSRLGRVRIR